MIEKLKAALAKITKRLTSREAEEDQAAKKSHVLTKEIKRLRDELDATSKTHAATLKLAEQTGDPQRQRKLLAQAQAEEQDIQLLHAKLERKVGKRSSWRKRRKKAQKRVAWWLRRQTTVRKQLKAAKEKWEREHRTDFEPWMLNGCPNINNDRLKAVIAYQVVVCGQYVTATTNGTHTPTSYHYREEAVDTGSTSVSSMQEAAVKTREKFGRSYFVELFSPCPWYLKYGVEYPGYFPGHGDHGHYGVEK